MSRIVVVEDDRYLREELVTTFKRKGYSVLGISSFDETEKEILKYDPDLAVLDINLPGKSGFELCRQLKERAAFPILILTARDTLGDELHALGLGADDFLTKPCHPDRLTARVARLIQTYKRVHDCLKAKSLILDLDAGRAAWKDRHTDLTETEGKILKVLMEYYPQMVPKEELFERLWGGSEYVDDNILQVNMARLRKSMDNIGLREAIQTVRARGYRLEVDGYEGE